MIYPGEEMVRFATLPRMWDRTITIGSAGKSWSATGWKVGWSVNNLKNFIFYYICSNTYVGSYKKRLVNAFV
jgi:aspartate/methionine/tyrosine aminotransferase